MLLMKKVREIPFLAGMLFVIPVLLFSVLIRLSVFEIAHKGSDEMQYIGLAYKLDKYGIESYNLKNLSFNYELDGMLFNIDDIASANSTSVLEGLPAYYDIPLFHKPPALPFLIMVSHRIFGVSDQYLGAVHTPRDKLKSLYGKKIFDSQLYISLICIFFILLAVVCVFLIAKYFFDFEVAFYSALLFSVTPVVMMTSVRLWTDIPAMSLMFLSFYFYLQARDRGMISLAVLSGVILAFAGMTRTVTLMLMPIVCCLELLWLFLGDNDKKSQRGRIVVGFLFFAVLLSIPWFALLYKHYGSVFYFPANNLETVNNNNWLKMISGRNPFVYIVNPLAQNPVLILFYIFWGKVIAGREFVIADKKSFGKAGLLIIFVGFVIVFSLLPFKEVRYILPALTVMAVFSAPLLKRMRQFFMAKTGALQGLIITFFLLAVSAWWGISVAFYFLRSNSVLITFPF